MSFNHFLSLDPRKNNKLKYIMILNYCVNKKLVYNLIFMA